MSARRRDEREAGESSARRICIDGNEAAARVAHRLSEVIAIYRITPASPMGEIADTWSAQGRENLWGRVPEIVEMRMVEREYASVRQLCGSASQGSVEDPDAFERASYIQTLHSWAGPQPALGGARTSR
jgi:hypothetical protein